jgi:electron transport complex protein RnfG
MRLRDRENMVVLGTFLGGVALLAALLLAVVSQLTAEPIRNAAERNREQAFHRLLLPEFDRIGDGVECDGFFFYPVYQADEIVGFAGQGVSRAGYGGEIEVLVGFGCDGKITGVQILRHKETPGLGANVCERKFQRTVFNFAEEAPAVPENRFLDQFNNRDAFSAGEWRVVKDGGEFEYLTGATVTSRAVTALVNDIAVAFANSGLCVAMEK